MHGFGDGWGWGMGFMWIFGLLLVALLVWVLFLSAGGTRQTGTRDPAEEELRIRYARGDIDRDEFERRLSDLRR